MTGTVMGGVMGGVTRTVVAVIPEGATIDAALAVMKAMSGCYPPETLLMQHQRGHNVIVHDPSLKGTSVPAKPTHQLRVALGETSPGDLLTQAFTVRGKDQQTGLKAMALFLADLLEESGAANFVEMAMQVPDVGEYGVIVQRAGRTADPGARLAAMLAEFHHMIGQLPWEGPVEEMPKATLATRNRLMREEVRELVKATNAGDLVGILDALADIVYVAFGTAFTYRLPLGRALLEVHASNMTKEAGPTGKAVKGKGFVPPDIAGLLADRLPATTDNTG